MAKQESQPETVEAEIVADGPANEMDQPGAVVRRSEFDQKLIDQQEIAGEDNKDPYERIIRQVLTADSPDAVLTPVDVLQGRDLIGENIVIIDFDLNQSEFDVGAPFYASCRVLRSPGEPPVVVNCGHKKVIAQLVRLKELNAFPIQTRFMTRGKSKAGGTPLLELAKWDEEPVEPPF